MKKFGSRWSYALPFPLATTTWYLRFSSHDFVAFVIWHLRLGTRHRFRRRRFRPMGFASGGIYDSAFTTCTMFVLLHNLSAGMTNLSAGMTNHIELKRALNLQISHSSMLPCFKISKECIQWSQRRAFWLKNAIWKVLGRDGAVGIVWFREILSKKINKPVRSNHNYIILYFVRFTQPHQPIIRHDFLVNAFCFFFAGNKS